MVIALHFCMAQVAFCPGTALIITKHGINVDEREMREMWKGGRVLPNSDECCILVIRMPCPN